MLLSFSFHEWFYVFHEQTDLPQLALAKLVVLRQDAKLYSARSYPFRAVDSTLALGAATAFEVVTWCYPAATKARFSKRDGSYLRELCSAVQ